MPITPQNAKQLLEGLLMGPLHRHAADLQPRRGLPEREALEDGEPEGRGLGCRQLIDQLLQLQLLLAQLEADSGSGAWRLFAVRPRNPSAPRLAKICADTL